MRKHWGTTPEYVLTPTSQDSRYRSTRRTLPHARSLFQCTRFTWLHMARRDEFESIIEMVRERRVRVLRRRRRHRQGRFSRRVSGARARRFRLECASARRFRRDGRKSALFGNAFLVTTIHDPSIRGRLLLVKRYGSARASFRDARSSATRRVDDRAKKTDETRKNFRFSSCFRTLRRRVTQTSPSAEPIARSVASVLSKSSWAS